MTRYDLSPLFRSTVGFDRLARLVDSATRIDDSTVSYPPYNIVKTADDSYRVSMAVAGFAPEDLDITVHENSLIVTGRAKDDEKPSEYLHRGIAARAFERRFQLADHIKVVGAALANGLLDINLVREVPEQLKPRKIVIAGTSQPTVIEQKAA
jgi:molecular chaperone IbpA